MLQGGGSTTARDMLERAKQKKAEQDQADDTPQPVCVCQNFFRVIFSLPLQIYGSQCDERATWGLPCLWREGVGKKCKRPFLSFLSTPVRGSSKGGGGDRKEMQTSCSNVLMFPCTPTTQDTWVIDSIFGTPIAPSSSWYSLDVFYTIQYRH